MVSFEIVPWDNLFRGDFLDFHGFQQTWCQEEGFLTVITNEAIVVSKIESKAQIS